MQRISGEFLLPKRPVFQAVFKGIFELFPAPAAVVGARGLWAFQPPALPPVPLTAFVLGYVAGQPFDAPVLKIQAFATGPAFAPKVLYGFPLKPRRAAYDRMVVVPPQPLSVLVQGAVLSHAHPLRTLYPVFVAVAVKALDEVREVPIRLRHISRSGQMLAGVGQCQRVVLPSEIGAHQLAQVTPPGFLVVLVLHKARCQLLLGPDASFMLGGGDLKHVHFHVRRAGIVVTADMFLFSNI